MGKVCDREKPGKAVKILMIVDTAPPLYGGAGQQAHLLARSLRGLGHSVDIVARQKERVGRKQYSGVTFVRPYVSSGSLSNLYFTVAVFVRTLVSRADVVHVHGAYYYGFAAILAARLRGKPSLLKITLLGKDDPLSVRKMRPGGLPLGQVLFRQFRWATMIVALNDDVRMAVAAADEDLAVTKISNGVSVAGPAGPSGHTSPHFVFTGELCFRKGVDTLLEAWPLVREIHPNAELSLLGPIASEIASLIDSSTPEALQGITFFGSLDHETAVAHLRESDVFVFPSTMEGLPNSLVEAMANGLPCVASDIIVNVSTAGESAIYFPVGNTTALSEAMIQGWARRSELSAASHEAAARFDMRLVAGTYDLLYSELITNSPRANVRIPEDDTL
jgi:glycosyltransferase involved in cell wall biosynthesis